MSSRIKGKTQNKNRKTQQKVKQRTAEQGSGDLLIPILLIIAVLPLVVYFKAYSSGLAKFDWYAIDDTVTDFYSFYKSRFLLWVSGACVLILAFRLPLYPEKRKRLQLFVPLAVYMAAVIFSALFSIDRSMSLSGAPYMYESVWVLLSYVVICFYTYQIVETEKDYRTLHRAILILLAIMLVVGLFQIAGKDLLNFESIQRLVMSKEDETEFLGTFVDAFTRNYVYLTMLNPNYAGQFLAMVSCYILTFLVTETERRKKFFYGCLFAALLLLLWFTYSRGALVALLAGGLCACLLPGLKKSRKALVRGGAFVLAMFLAAVLLDAANDFHFLGRLRDQKEEHPLESITTGDEVTIVYDGKTQVIDDLTEGEVRAVTLDGREWNFILEDGVYSYINEFGKLDQIPVVEKVSLGGYEYLGSARLYIWSRVLPLLKKYFLLGSGPDTFLEAFPQDDYVGKANYSHSVTMYIEKAHNGYLMCWEQTGVISLLALLAFAAWLCVCFARSIKGKKALWKQNGQLEHNTGALLSVTDRMQLACFAALTAYAVGLLSNDSTLHTTPLACVLAGIVAAASDNKD
jgi:hypothetical protein